MAIRLETSIKRYIGLSTDTRPRVGVQIDGTEVKSNDLPIGSSLLLEDTKQILRWNGSDWGQYPEVLPADPMGELGSLVVSEMADLKDWISLATSKVAVHPVFGDGIKTSQENPFPVGSVSIVQRHVLKVDIAGAYVAGDVLAMPIELKGLAAPGGKVLLQSARVIDKADQGAAFDMLFFRALPVVAALNAAWVTTDFEMEFFEDINSVNSYTDLGANRVSSMKSINSLLQCNESGGLWLCTVSQGTPTYVATDDLIVILAFLRL